MSPKLNKFKAGIVIFFLLTVSHAFAAENPYKDVEVERAAGRVINEFNRFDFLESIVSGPDGAIFTTNLFQGVIYKFKNGKLSKLTDVDGKLVGLGVSDNENLIVTGSDSQNKATVFHVNINTGKTTTITTIPDALLLNGISKIDDHHFLIADSFKGVIWKLDVRDGSVSIWLDHDLLASPSVETQSPGINGIKIHNNAAYISNTGKMLMVKIPFMKNGSAGKPEVIQESVFIDDFAMDETGNIYGATHVYDSVIKITPQGEVTIIAQSDQGVSGSTCVTMQYGSKNTLLVSTNGGMLKPDPCNVVPAKIVELELRK